MPGGISFQTCTASYCPCPSCPVQSSYLYITWAVTTLHHNGYISPCSLFSTYLCFSITASVVFCCDSPQTALPPSEESFVCTCVHDAGRCTQPDIPLSTCVCVCARQMRAVMQHLLTDVCVPTCVCVMLVGESVQYLCL